MDRDDVGLPPNNPSSGTEMELHDKGCRSCVRSSRLLLFLFLEYESNLTEGVNTYVRYSEGHTSFLDEKVREVVRQHILTLTESGLSKGNFDR